MSLQVFITLAVLVAAVVSQGAPLTVNTPTSVVACLPVQITWSGGQPPYYVSVIPGGQPGGTPIKDFGKQDGNSLTWNVEQGVNSPISIQIRDGTGVLNYSDKVNVQSSTASCGTASSTSNSSSSAAPAKSGSTPSSSTPSTSTSSPSSNSTAKPSGSSSNSSSTSGAASSSTPTSGSSPASSTPAAAGATTGDASRTLPAFFALGLSAAIAVFA